MGKFSNGDATCNEEWFEFKLAILKIKDKTVRDWLEGRLSSLAYTFTDDFRKGKEETIKREKNHLAKEIVQHLPEIEYRTPLSQWLQK